MGLQSSLRLRPADRRRKGFKCGAKAKMPNKCFFDLPVQQHSSYLELPCGRSPAAMRVMGRCCAQIVREMQGILSGYKKQKTVHDSKAAASLLTPQR